MRRIYKIGQKKESIQMTHELILKNGDRLAVLGQMPSREMAESFKKTLRHEFVNEIEVRPIIKE